MVGFAIATMIFSGKTYSVHMINSRWRIIFTYYEFPMVSTIPSSVSCWSIKQEVFLSEKLRWIFKSQRTSTVRSEEPWRGGNGTGLESREINSTLPETNSKFAPGNRLNPKKGNDHILTIHFQGLLLFVSGRVSFWFNMGSKRAGNPNCSLT